MPGKIGPASTSTSAAGHGARPAGMLGERVMVAAILTITEAAPLLPPRGGLIGLDLGTKTIGVASSDPDRRLAAPVETMLKALLACLAEQIAAIEDAIEQIRREVPAIAKAAQALRSIAGIGPATAAALIALMPELGSIPRRQAAESVVKKGLPVPAEKITTLPARSWLMASAQT